MAALVVPDVDDGQFRAATTNAQVKALGKHFEIEPLATAVNAHIAATPFRRAASVDPNVARRWLSNAWNTERLLRLQTEMD